MPEEVHNVAVVTMRVDTGIRTSDIISVPCMHYDTSPQGVLLLDADNVHLVVHRLKEICLRTSNKDLSDSIPVHGEPRSRMQRVSMTSTVVWLDLLVKKKKSALGTRHSDAYDAMRAVRGVPKNVVLISKTKFRGTIMRNSTKKIGRKSYAPFQTKHRPVM